MPEKKEGLVARSFKINSKEVGGLTSEKLLELSKAELSYRGDDGEKPTVEVVRHSIQEKPGKYPLVLGVTHAEGEREELEVTVKVRNQKKILFYLLSLLALLALVGGIWWYNSRPTNVASGLPSVATEKMSPVELKKYAEKEVDKSNVTVQVYPRISVQEDGQTAKMYVQNVPSNETGQVAVLKDKETGEVLYSSDLLKPGYQVSDIQLNKKLSKGKHQGIVTLTFYDLKEEKQVGKTNVAVTINVS